MLHFYKTPKIFKYFSSDLLWDIPVKSNEIYLTFDDGPIPGLTDYVLDVLDEFDAKSTFFCVGENMLKYPSICSRIVEKEHLVGNHTFHHLKGWTTKTINYIKDVDKCQRIISTHQKLNGVPLFRPPYGKITTKQINKLRANYKIIMWDILAYDFAKDHNPKKSLRKIIDKTRPGSIVVFHDNYKAEHKLKYMLPKYLRHFKDKGFAFKKLDSFPIK